MIFFLMLATITAPPIQRVGDSCPLGYWQSGGYCVISPGAVEVRDTIPNATLGTCPVGWYGSKGYCIKNH